MAYIIGMHAAEAGQPPPTSETSSACSEPYALDLVYLLEYLIHTKHDAIEVNKPTPTNSACPLQEVLLSSSNSSVVAIADVVAKGVTDGVY